MMNVSTLRPGLLVSLKTSIMGNVNYKRDDIEAEHVTAEGVKRARWETERVIQDPEEHEKAVIVRGKCRSLIAGVCSSSTFGMLCPEDKQEELETAIRNAQLLAEAFNSGASLTRIGIYVIAGRIAPDDVQAVRAINSEVRDLLASMENGLTSLDVKAVREAAAKAKSIGQMLSPAAQERIKAAVDLARDLATKIKKAGEEGAKELDEAAIRKLRESRTSFLDLDGSAEIAAPSIAARGVDLMPSEDAKAPEHIARQAEVSDADFGTVKVPAQRMRLPELEAGE